MLIIPAGVKIHMALGHTDMRKGFDSLAVLVQEGAQEGFVLGLSLRLEQPRCPSPYRRMSDHVQSPPRRIKIVIDVSPPTISSQTERRLAFRVVLALQLQDQDKQFLCSSVAVLAATNLLCGLGGVLGTMLLTIRGCSRRIMIPGVPGAEYDLRVGRSDAKSFASKSASFSSSMFAHCLVNCRTDSVRKTNVGPIPRPTIGGDCATIRIKPRGRVPALDQLHELPCAITTFAYSAKGDDYHRPWIGPEASPIASDLGMYQLRLYDECACG